MLPLGEVAQAVEGRGLTVNRRLRVELLAIEREAVVHKLEVVAQAVSELDVRGVRLDGEFNGPGNLGHAVGSLGEGPRLLPRDITVLGGDIDRSHTREHDRCVATRTNILVFKLEREVCRDMDIRRVFCEPRLVKRKDNLLTLDLPRASLGGRSLRALHEVATCVVNDDGVW